MQWGGMLTFLPGRRNATSLFQPHLFLPRFKGNEVCHPSFFSDCFLWKLCMHYNSLEVTRFFFRKSKTIKLECFFSISLLFKRKDFLYFLERREGSEKEKERNINWCLSQVPSLGPGPQPRYVPWPEVKLAAFQAAGWCSMQEPHQPGPSISFK